MQTAIFEAEFSKILDGKTGAEGPVFTADGQCYMVAPEIQIDRKWEGEILKVNLETAEVSCKTDQRQRGGGCVK